MGSLTIVVYVDDISKACLWWTIVSDAADHSRPGGSLLLMSTSHGVMQGLADATREHEFRKGAGQGLPCIQDVLLS